ncbi:hypothetical protein QYF61_005247 [Mycteria americana]|uniref:Reverse transcriptase domain-containing protein n=1 Tax=Mycteria americana TaxID=33587 RepID=A0AAN7NHP9_MYCAM|nr:hypothetical protein QYF61_005247 [Mycteria americana]
MLAGPDPLVGLHMPVECTQDEPLHNFPQYRGLLINDGEWLGKLLHQLPQYSRVDPIRPHRLVHIFSEVQCSKLCNAAEWVLPMHSLTYKNLLETISKYLKNRKVSGSSQHGFTKGKSCLTNLITFYNEVTGLVDQGRAVDVVYLDLSNGFDTFSHNILIDKLTKYRLENWRQLTSGDWTTDRGQYWGQCCLTSSLTTGCGDIVYPREVRRRCKTGMREGMSCHSEGPGQAGEIGREESDEVEQGEIPSPASGEE